MKSRLPEKRIIDTPVKNLEDIFSGKGFEFLWLGQSGFIFSLDRTYILADAYLSNYLEANHGELPYGHERMIPAPVEDSVLTQLDYILISHGHEDHLDPELIKKIAAVNSGAVFIIPPGCKDAVLALGVKPEAVIAVDYRGLNQIDDGFSINAAPAAHPEPDFDPQKVWALSYQINYHGKSVFFAGDTTVYPQLTDWLISKRFDLLLLPANGRDPVMEKNGIVGNMNLEEGMLLSVMLDVPLLGTHFGMFAFNTIDPHEALHRIDNFGLEHSVGITELNTIYRI